MCVQGKDKVYGKAGCRRREKQADEPAQQREERLARRRERQADEPAQQREERLVFFS